MFMPTYRRTQHTPRTPPFPLPLQAAYLCALDMHSALFSHADGSNGHQTFSPALTSNAALPESANSYIATCAPLVRAIHKWSERGLGDVVGSKVAAEGLSVAMTTAFQEGGAAVGSSVPRVGSHNMPCCTCMPSGLCRRCCMLRGCMR